jgi:hypothetical protein
MGRKEKSVDSRKRTNKVPLAFGWYKMLSPLFPLSNTANYITRVLICLRGGGILERG